MEELRALTDRLNEYAYRYYVLDEPVVSDAEYDALYDRLQVLEERWGALPDSPTQRVGGALLPGFAKHAHLAPLYSLDKAKTEAELLAWEERVHKLAGPQRYSLEYKFDGLTLNLTYEDGALVQAASRGDGVTGEGILEQVKTIRSVPLSIPFAGRMEVQGEAIMHLSVLEAYNATAQEPLKNARNAAAGALRNLDPAVTAARKLDAFFYNVGYIEGKSFANHGEMIAFLRENRFKVSEYEREYANMTNVLAAIDQVAARRDTLDFLIDGMVIKVCDFAARERMGYTQKFPRWAIAYKFEAEELTTTVQDVVWEVGRTGRLTPTAVLAPVEIGGATVRRATLNNYEDILRKKVRLGARVFVRRSNDVIPEVLGAVEGQDELPAVPRPVVCPACGARLEAIGPNLFCPNTLSCRPQLVARMAHFVSRDAMNIEALSEKTLQLLFDELHVADISALYDIAPEQLLRLPGFQQKRAEKIVHAIQDSKQPELPNYLFALGVNNVGKKTARDLAEAFGTLEGVAAATREQLTALRDVGEVVADCILDFFADHEVQRVLARLAEQGVRPRAFVKKTGVFSGKNVVFTGTLARFTRGRAGELIQAEGGAVQSAVGKTTDYLVAGEKAGSKLKKAAALGVTVLTEEQFLEMIGGEDAARS